MRWEEKYKKYDVQKADERIEELNQKYNDKTITSKELKELKMEKAIRANIDKVANIMEFSKKLDEYRHKINRELQRREAFEKATLETEAQYEKNNNELLELKAKLKDKDLSDEERQKVSDEIKKLNVKNQENNNKYLKIKEMEKGYQEKDGKDFVGKSNEELINDKLEISEDISICGFVCANLMKGMDWDTVEFKMFSNKRFNSQQKLTEKFGKEKPEKEEQNEQTEENEKPETVTEEVEKPETVTEEVENTETAIEEQLPTENGMYEQVKQRIAATFANIKENMHENQEETSLIESKVSDFMEKHPKLARFFNGIKEKISSIFNRKQEKEEIVEPVEDIEELTKDVEEVVPENEQIEEKTEIEVEEVAVNEEQENNEEFMSKRKQFVDLLKDVADKGIYQVNEERKQAIIDEKEAELRRQKEEIEKAKRELVIKEADLRIAEQKDKQRRKEAAKKRFYKMKQEAYEKEADIYGEKYAQNSRIINGDVEEQSIQDDGEER